MKHTSDVDWIRLEPKTIKGVSNIWNALVHYFPVLENWLAWIFGSESQVLIADDPWCVGSLGWKLSKDLILLLQGKDIYTLKDVIFPIEGRGHYWKQAHALDLHDDFKEEWTSFIKYVSDVVIELFDSNDTLVWKREEK